MNRRRWWVSVLRLGSLSLSFPCLSTTFSLTHKHHHHYLIMSSILNTLCNLAQAPEQDPFCPCYGPVEDSVSYTSCPCFGPVEISVSWGHPLRLLSFPGTPESNCEKAKHLILLWSFTQPCLSISGVPSFFSSLSSFNACSSLNI